MPIRIQRKRSKGWRMPENTVYVGRPTVYGNIFRAGDRSPHNINIILDAEHAVELFKQHLKEQHRMFPFAYYSMLESLKGKDLACWCPLDKPCHADVLLELAERYRK